MNKLTFDEINERTGFANGERFNSAEDVRQYFQRAELLAMMHDWCDSDIPTQTELDEMAEAVISHRWHMTP